MAPAVGVSSTPTSSKKGKKTGVPTRDKLSKAIAYIQSKDASSKDSSQRQSLGNDFANSLYRTINQENHPSSPRRKFDSESPKASSGPLTPRAAAAAALISEKRRSRGARNESPGAKKSGDSSAHRRQLNYKINQEGRPLRLREC